MDNVSKDLIVGSQLQNLAKAGEVVILPPAQEAGKSMQGLITLMFSEPLRHQIEMKKIANLHKEELLRKELEERINAIPTENLIEPNPQIFEPVYLGSRFCYDSDHLRSMFLNLLSLLFDSRSEFAIHPVFSSIINQLSPRDASNLILFSEKPEYPIVRFTTKHPGDHLLFRILYSDVFISNPNYNDIENQSLSLSALSQLGLLAIKYDLISEGVDDYKDFEKSPECIAFLSTLSQENRKIEIQEGCVIITPLGKAFLSIVLSS